MSHYRESRFAAPGSIETNPSSSSWNAPENYNSRSQEPRVAAFMHMEPPPQTSGIAYHKYVVDRHVLTKTTICSAFELEESEVLRLANLAPDSELFSSTMHRTDEVSQTTSASSSKMHGPSPGFQSSSEGPNQQPPFTSSAQISRSRGAFQSNRRIYFYNKDEPYYGFTNFSPHPVVYQGKVYSTSEHLFQSLKFHPDRPLIAEHIRLSDSPRTAFSEAQSLKHLVRQDWASVKIGIMEEVVWQKFSQNEELREELLETGDAELFEDSLVDSFWGGGSDRQGRNELGKALMRIRTRFRAVSK